MPNAIPPNPANVNNAPANNKWLAERLFANHQSDILGRNPANGDACTSCGRSPESDQLCKVVIDPITNLTAAVGIGRCHHDFLRASLESLLRDELAGHNPRKVQNVNHLKRLIAKLPSKLP